MDNGPDAKMDLADRIPGSTPFLVAIAKASRLVGASSPSKGALSRQALVRRVQAETAPLAIPGTKSAESMAMAIQRMTARDRPLSDAAALRMVTRTRTTSQVLGGLNPVGQAAEIVFITEVEAHRAGVAGAIVNPPPPPQPNELGLRQSPDGCGKQDVLVHYEKPDGSHGIGGTTQVKVGAPNDYVAPALVRDLGPGGKPGYGIVAAVDGRLVDPDGSPRVGEDAFTATRAKQITAAGTELRGVPDLEAKAKRLVGDVEGFAKDGLDPVDRETISDLGASLLRVGGLMRTIGLQTVMGIDPAEALKVYRAHRAGKAPAPDEDPIHEVAASVAHTAGSKGVLKLASLWLSRFGL